MIVDSSAVVAVALRQQGFEPVLEALLESPGAGIGAPTLLEATIVLSARLDRDARGLVARLVQELGLVVVPFGEEHADEAAEAFLRFGKGRHPAALNFGDCLTYAVASLSDEPLLCLGDDFTRTDLKLVLHSPRP
jgi:ribonuclease VapC